jgi:hypothetical protein
LQAILSLLLTVGIDHNIDTLLEALTVPRRKHEL